MKKHLQEGESFLIKKMQVEKHAMKNHQRKNDSAK
jgi:hypothetical protein